MLQKKIKLGELSILGEQCIQSSIWLTRLEFLFFFHVQLNDSQVLYLTMFVPTPSKANIQGKIIQCLKKMCHSLSK